MLIAGEPAGDIGRRNSSRLRRRGGGGGARPLPTSQLTAPTWQRFSPTLAPVFFGAGGPQHGGGGRGVNGRMTQHSVIWGSRLQTISSSRE